MSTGTSLVRTSDSATLPRKKRRAHVDCVTGHQSGVFVKGEDCRDRERGFGCFRFGLQPRRATPCRGLGDGRGFAASCIRFRRARLIDDREDPQR
jgi:hypothetical protein